jgi:hypothetical protein
VVERFQSVVSQLFQQVLPAAAKCSICSSSFCKTCLPCVWLAPGLTPAVHAASVLTGACVKSAPIPMTSTPKQAQYTAPVARDGSWLRSPGGLHIQLAATSSCLMILQQANCVFSSLLTFCRG